MYVSAPGGFECRSLDRCGKEHRRRGIGTRKQKALYENQQVPWSPWPALGALGIVLALLWWLLVLWSPPGSANRPLC